MSRKVSPIMAHPTAITASTLSASWPARYRGVGVSVEPLADGTYCGVVATGYRSSAYATPTEALAAATAWIDAHSSPSC